MRIFLFLIFGLSIAILCGTAFLHYPIRYNYNYERTKSAASCSPCSGPYTPTSESRWRSACPSKNIQPERIGILLTADKNYEHRFKRHLNLWKCYATLHGYRYFFEVIPPHDVWEPKVYFAKVRYSIKYLQEVDYLLFLDLDTIPFDFSQRLEDLIDTRFEVFFVDRDDSVGEVMSATFLLHRSNWTAEFLMEWLSLEKWILDGKSRNADNGALQLLLLRHFTPDLGLPNVYPAEYGRSNMPCVAEFLKGAQSWQDYYKAIACYRQAIAQARILPGKIKLFAPWMGWLRIVLEWGISLHNNLLQDDFALHIKTITNLLNETETPFERCDRALMQEHNLRLDRLVKPSLNMTVFSDAQAREGIVQFYKQFFNKQPAEWRFIVLLAQCYPRCSELLI